MRPRWVVILGLGLAALTPSAVTGQPPTLATALALAGEYVRGFNRDLAGIVAEEQYVQDISDSALSAVKGRGMAMPPDLSSVHREFKADLLLVRPEGSDRYIQFRDVFEVDGIPVRDRSERLLKLFVQPTASALSQANRIMDESARYNLGPVERNMNVPVFPLSFLDPDNQPRFRFTGKMVPGSDGPLKASSGSHFSSAADIWVVEYREIAPGTFIRTGQDRDLPSRGRFWIDASSGRVMMTELVAEDATVHANITVTYESPATIGVPVPIEMRETYWQSGYDRQIDAVATYHNFRRFKVSSDELIALPTPPSVRPDDAVQR